MCIGGLGMLWQGAAAWEAAYRRKNADGCGMEAADREDKMNNIYLIGFMGTVKLRWQRRWRKVKHGRHGDGRRH